MRRNINKDKNADSLVPLKHDGFTIARAFYDPASRDTNTVFPSDTWIDVFTVSDGQLAGFLETAPVLYDCGGTTIVRLLSTLILKGGRLTRPCEAAAMDLARSMTSISIPKVHRVVHIDIKDSSYEVNCLIVMDFIEGPSVEEAWDGLIDTQREDVVSQIASMITTLENTNVPQDPGPVGLETKSGPWEGPWFTDYGAGPFSIVAEMEAWFNRKLAICKDLRQTAESVPPFRFGRLVLTHGDIAPRNLILEIDGKVWLIDWGDAGVYPVGMDAATLALNRFRAPGFTDLLLARTQRHEVFSSQLQSIGYGLTTGALIE